MTPETRQQLENELREYISNKRSQLIMRDTPDHRLRLALMELQWERDFWRDKVLDP